MTSVVHRINGREVSQEEWDRATRPGRLQEMLSDRKAPRANTDREFLLGHCNGSQFEGQEARGDALRALAEAAGQSTKGKVYMGSLARFPGDPQAWVDGKGDAERVIEQNGWGSQGAISRPVTRVAEPAAQDVDPAIVQDEVEAIIDRAGAGPGVDKLDLAEQVYNKRAGVHKKKDFEPARDSPAFVEDLPCPLPD